MRAFEFFDFLFEAAYDGMMASLKAKYPNFANEIDFAKKVLKRQDRAVWYLTVLKQMVEKTPLDNEVELVDTKDKLNDIREQLKHFLEQNIPGIEAYIFDKTKTSEQTFNELTQIENEFKSRQDTEKGVEPQTGDKKLISYPNGFNWWYIDRPYCREEGRSGKHCGNIEGQRDTSQRILSFRDPQGRVLLTFILNRDGTLGEMKAKGNQKPGVNMHSVVVDLLLNDIVKGIKSGGYAADMNFSIFDLKDELQNKVLEKKPNLVMDQINYNPLEITKGSDEVKSNKEVINFLRRNKPDIYDLMTSADTEKYLKILQSNPDYVVFAPLDLPNYKELLTKAILRKPKLLQMAPKQYKNSFEYNKEILKENPDLIANVNVNIPRYTELCKIAIDTKPESAQKIPVDLQSDEIWAYTLDKDPLLLKIIPKEKKSVDVQQRAYNKNPDAYAYMTDDAKSSQITIDYIENSKQPKINLVPESQRSEKIILRSIEKNGENLIDIPDDKKTHESCLAAVKQDGYNLLFVQPERLKDFEMCKAALESNGRGISFVPDNLLKKDDGYLVKLAVKTTPAVLSEWVKPSERTDELCRIAVESDPEALVHVPENKRTYELCLLASKKLGSVAKGVPEKYVSKIEKELKKNTD
jgi:hypothetical protein